MLWHFTYLQAGYRHVIEGLYTCCNSSNSVNSYNFQRTIFVCAEKHDAFWKDFRQALPGWAWLATSQNECRHSGTAAGEAKDLSEIQSIRSHSWGWNRCGQWRGQANFHHPDFLASHSSRRHGRVVLRAYEMTTHACAKKKGRITPVCVLLVFNWFSLNLTCKPEPPSNEICFNLLWVLLRIFALMCCNVSARFCRLKSYLRLPMYAKLLPFQELLLAACFLPPNRFCIFLMLHMFAGFETAKKPNETAKKPDETAKKIKSPNVETETAKKTGNSENLGNRR